MKRFTTFLLTLTLLITLVAVPVSAQGTAGLTVRVGSVTATAGNSNVAVEISLANNPGIAGFSFCVDYDADNLVLVRSELNISGGYPVATPINDHQVNIAWAGNGTYSSNGKIATLYFNIPKDAEIGKSDLAISYRNGYDSFYQYSGGTEQDISATAVNGCLQIDEAVPATKLTVTAGAVTASMSDTDVTVPITIANNDGLSGFSFCIDYDESRLEFKSAEITIDGGYKVINYPEGYAVCIAWTDENQYVQNTSIAELHFSVKSKAKPGKAFVNVLFRDGYDSFYKTVNKQEVDIECVAENGYVNILNHNFGEWQIIKEATCTETGLKRRSCTDAGCTEVDELVIPKIAHSYVDTVTEATCSNEGYTTHKCSFCGTSYVDTYVEKTAHTVGEWEITVQPGCTSPGTKIKKCSVCNEVIETEEIRATGHVYGEWETFKEATFSEDGESRKYCQKCDYYQSKRIPKLSESHTHNFTGREEIVKNATCTEEGSKKVYCYESECGEFTTVTITPTGHSYGEWTIVKNATFSEKGLKQKVCSGCGDVITEETTSLSEGHVHSYTGTEEITKQPTCTASGSKRVYCFEPECGDYITVSIAPTGHTEGEWETTVSPGCLTNGTKVKKCTKCHEVIETAAIPATGHTPGEWEITVPATCTSSGLKVKKCTTCGTVVESQSIDMISHDFEETIIPATPTAQGYTLHKCKNCPYSYKDSFTEYVEESNAQIIIESKSVAKGEEFTVAVEIKNNPGFAYLELAPNYPSSLTLVKVTNGELVSDLTKGNQYVWVADEDVTDDGLLMTFTFSSASDIESGEYTVSFTFRTCSDYEEKLVTFEIIDGVIEIVDFIYGDVNGDGVIDGLDVVRLKKYLANYDYNTETSTVEICSGADANGDGTVDGLDVVRLKKYLANYDYDTATSTIVLGAQ